MRCNIVYTKMEEERTWNLRKAKKWKSRAKKTSRQETPTGFRKKKRTGRSGARTQDRPVTCQICLRIFGCACLRHWAGCLPYYKEKNQSTWNANWFLKKRSEVDALGLEPRTVRLLAKSAYAFLASHAFGIEPDAYHITKKRTSRHETPTDSWKKEAKWTLWDSNPGPSGYEPDALTNWAKRPRVFLTHTICLKFSGW